MGKFSTRFSAQAERTRNKFLMAAFVSPSNLKPTAQLAEKILDLATLPIRLVIFMHSGFSGNCANYQIWRRWWWWWCIRRRSSFAFPNSCPDVKKGSAVRLCSTIRRFFRLFYADYLHGLVWPLDDCEASCALEEDILRGSKCCPANR